MEQLIGANVMMSVVAFVVLDLSRGWLLELMIVMLLLLT